MAPQTKADRRRFTVDTAPPALTAAGSDVPEEFWPTRKQYDLYWQWVRRDLGADPYGNWHGYCPMHDVPDQDGNDQRPVTAMLNFNRGALRCLGEPSCHEGQRAITFANAMIRRMQSQMGEVTSGTTD